jgi:hypothetical protein
MTKQELNRRGFHQLALAALGGVVAGSAVGCPPQSSPPAAPKGTGDTAQHVPGERGRKGKRLCRPGDLQSRGRSRLQHDESMQRTRRMRFQSR